MATKKVDRRIQRTRKLLQDALITLILEKGYDKITVQDIIDEANVGRSTFYAHYLDKDDLMAGSMEPLRAELHQHLIGADNDHEQEAAIASLALFRHTKEQYHLYKAMIGGRGIDIVVKAINDALLEHAQTHFEQVERDGRQLAVPVPVVTTFLASTLQTLLRWWLDNDMPYSPERMNEMFLQLVMGGIDSVVQDSFEVSKRTIYRDLDALS
ncbi:MAG: TetR family transcriptional regulator [Chloroflexi bacterium]|nr:TetR family transcriptional regulator [Chloroflexota bacterium]